jgi:hypothetical protein
LYITVPIPHHSGVARVLRASSSDEKKIILIIENFIQKMNSKYFSVIRIVRLKNTPNPAGKMKNIKKK